MPARIRSEDEVIVIGGKDRGKRGKVLRVEPKKERVYVEGLNMIKRHQRPQQAAARPDGRRGDRARGSDPRLQRDADRPEGRQADPRRGRSRGRQARPRRQAQRSRDWTRTMATARLKTRYLEEIRPALVEQFGYSSVMQAPKIQKVTVNMGCGDAKQDSKVLDAAHRAAATITGQQPNVRRARKSIAAVQAARGDAGRRLGDAARRAPVRVPGPADVGRDPADP